MIKDRQTRRAIDAKLGSALHYIEHAHRHISPETHGENYYPVIHDVEDVLEKLRAVIAA